MRIIEITALDNGAHRNQTSPISFAIPEGWAVVPEDMECENFPFGDIEVEEVTYYRDVEIVRDVTHTEKIQSVGEDGNPVFDENGAPVMETVETTVQEVVTEQEEYTVPTVTKWIPGTMPEPEAKTPAEMREEAYNTEAIIEWDGDMITVTQASQLWQYYAAEGSDKAGELQALIASAKAEIREKYPDE